MDPARLSDPIPIYRGDTFTLPCITELGIWLGGALVVTQSEPWMARLKGSAQTSGSLLLYVITDPASRY